MVAVQWHPERSYDRSAASRALFAAFLDAARAWAASHERRCRRAVRELNATAGQIEKAFTQAGISELPVGAYRQIPGLPGVAAPLEPAPESDRGPGSGPNHPAAFCRVRVCSAAASAGYSRTFWTTAPARACQEYQLRFAVRRYRVTLAEAHGKKASFLAGGLAGSRTWKAKSMMAAWRRCRKRIDLMRSPCAR